jgi:hypothetical protein
MEFRSHTHANNAATSDLTNSVRPTWQVFKFKAPGPQDTNRVSRPTRTYVKLVWRQAIRGVRGAMTDQSSKQRRRTPVFAILAIATMSHQSTRCWRRSSKTFTPDMSLPRRFAPRATWSRRCLDPPSWISQRANMARQRHLKISCDRLTATLVTLAACLT